jgi:hypothetical protein
MKYKTRVEIELPLRSDPFKALTDLKNKGTIVQANVINATRLVIFFDNRQIDAETLLKITGGRIAKETGEVLTEREIRAMANKAKRFRNYNEILNVRI